MVPTETAPGNPVFRAGRTAGLSARRMIASRGSSPARLRSAMAVTVVVAIVFALLGAYGVNRRSSPGRNVGSE